MSNHSPLRELLPVTSSQHSSIPYGSCMSVYSAYFSRSAVSWVSQQDTICDGEINIFGLNNEAYIKKLKRYAGRLYPVSLNSKYSPIKIKESDRLDVFGKVVGKINSNDVPDYRF